MSEEGRNVPSTPDWESLPGVVPLPDSDSMPGVTEDQNRAESETPSPRRRARPGDKSCPHAWHLPGVNETHRCHLVADHPGKHLCSCGASQVRPLK